MIVITEQRPGTEKEEKNQEKKKDFFKWKRPFDFKRKGGISAC